MDLERKIIEQRISSIDQLEPFEREQVQADTELLALVSENRRLVHGNPKFGSAPDRGAILEQAYHRADNYKENTMTMISRMFAGKTLLLKAGLAVLLLIGLVGGSLLLMPRGTSWAAVNGYVLVFDFGEVGTGADAEVDEQAVHSKVELLNHAVRGWADKQKETDPKSKEQAVKLFLNVEVDDGNLQATVGFIDGTPELLNSLQASLAAHPELPVPSVTDSTWFTDKYGEPGGDAGIVVTIFSHRFTFPPGTDSLTAEQQINVWLAENKPELKAVVEIEDNGEGQEVRIRLIEDKN